MTIHTVVVDDDESFLKFVTFALVKHNFQVTPLSNGRDLMKHLLDHQPDLVFLDRLLPDLSGFTLAEKIKLRYPDILLVMFSTMGEAEDMIAGLQLGADEYLPKPFSTEMLIARVQALLRRCRSSQVARPLQFRELSLTKASRQVTIEGRELALTKTEFQLLTLLLENRGEVVTYNDILTHILGYSSELDDLHKNIFFHVASLRKKLGDYRGHIKTVRGFGYRFVE